MRYTVCRNNFVYIYSGSPVINQWFVVDNASGLGYAVVYAILDSQGKAQAVADKLNV